VLRRYEVPRWSNARLGERFDHLLAEHLLAGSRGGAEFGGVLALAVAFAPEDRACHFNVDLDGGGEVPQDEIVRRISECFGEGTFLVTSGGGRPGRYRLIGRTDRPMSIAQIGSSLDRILRGLGIAPAGGFAEIFPSTRDGRLPFGAGGCERFDLGLKSMGMFAPPVLARELLALRPVPLLRLAKKFPEPAAPTAKVSRRREKSRARLRPADPDVERLLRDGVAPGQRDVAIYRIAVEFLRRGMRPEEVVGALSRWISDGGIARTRGGRDPRSIRREIDRLPARVAKIFATHPMPGALRPEHLTADEILAIDDLVRRACRRYRRADPTVLANVAFRALPLLKACARAGLDGARIGFERWRDWGGKGYVRAREQLGIFSVVRDYLSLRTCARLGISAVHARARDYGTTFAFDLASPSPKRALGSSWAEALREAKAAAERRKKREAREATRAARAPVPEPAVETPRRTLPSALPPLLAEKIRSSSERHEREKARADRGASDDGDRRVLRGLRGVEHATNPTVVRARSVRGGPEGGRASPSGPDHGSRPAERARATRADERALGEARQLRDEPDEGAAERGVPLPDRGGGEHAAPAGEPTEADESDARTDFQAASGRSFRPSPSLSSGILQGEGRPPERSIVCLSFPCRRRR
jgi:hypothetical protein